jgi:phage baseplate assembly protein W
VTESLINHEPRIRLSRVHVDTIDDGKINLNLHGFYVPGGHAITLENITIS